MFIQPMRVACQKTENLKFNIQKQEVLSNFEKPVVVLNKKKSGARN